MKVSILIPVYNEALTLPLVIQRILNASLPAGCVMEVIVVDDGSTDGTAELLRQYKGSPVVFVHHSAANFGKGAALRVAIAKAAGDILLVQETESASISHALKTQALAHSRYTEARHGKAAGSKWRHVRDCRKPA